jgi:hypothetical protein
MEYIVILRSNGSLGVEEMGRGKPPPPNILRAKGAEKRRRRRRNEFNSILEQ